MTKRTFKSGNKGGNKINPASHGVCISFIAHKLFVKILILLAFIIF